MQAPKIITVAVLVLLLLGSAARVFRPLKATSVPQHTAVVAPATTSQKLPTGSLTIDGQTFTVELATTEAEKAQGLSDRATLAKNAGMLFVFNPPEQPDFWMKDMRFPLDFVWISNNKIVGLNQNVPAPKAGTPAMNLPLYPAPSAIDYVLELNAGTAADFHVGDTASTHITQST